MGHKHSREEILAGAVDAAFADGFSQLTFGRVAKRLGISDRTVVYYFPTKQALASEVLLSMGGQLQATLAEAFDGQVDDFRALLRAAWPVVSTTDASAVFALFFEANGLAAAGLEPYSSLVPALVETWIEWTAEFVTGGPKQRRIEAETAVAILDGLVLLRLVAGPDAATRAAKRLDVV